MDALLVFACIFGPVFALNLLGAGRDQLLFEERPRTHRGLKAAAVALALVVVLIVGLPLEWALALVLAGPLGLVLGHWVGSGEWRVLAHHVRRRLGSSD